MWPLPVEYPQYEPVRGRGSKLAANGGLEAMQGLLGLKSKKEKQMTIRIMMVLLIMVCILFSACSSPESEYRKAEELNTISSYTDFMKKNPDSILVSEAVVNIYILEYEKAEQTRTVEALKGFLVKYPYGKYEKTANAKIVELELLKAKQLDSVEGYQYFIDSYPNNPEVVGVKQRLDFCKLKSDFISCKEGTYRFLSMTSTINGGGSKYTESTVLHIKINGKEVTGKTENYSYFFTKDSYLSFFSFATMRTYFPSTFFEFKGKIDDNKIVLKKFNINKHRFQYANLNEGTFLSIENEKLHSEFFTVLSKKIKQNIDKSIIESNISNKTLYQCEIDFAFHFSPELVSIPDTEIDDCLDTK